MAKYRTDLLDFNFLLFDWLKIQSTTDGLEESELKDILGQFDHFVEKEIWPSRTSADEEGVKLIDGKVLVPGPFKNANQLFHENGWFSLGLPESIGGVPVPNALTVASSSLITGANISFSMYYGLSKAALNVILEVGSESQKKSYVDKMMSGEWGGTMCLTEANAGSDVGAVKTIAEKIDGTRYKVKGTKIFISSGDNDLYENIVHLVLARTSGAPSGTKGISLFIVPKNRLDEDGHLGEFNNVVCTNIEEKMGLHGSSTCEMVFGHEGDCIGELIGNEFDGMSNMFIMMNEARLLCGVQGEAQASMALSMSEQYASERVQFGIKIENLPDVKRVLSKMRAMSRGTKALNLYVSYLFDLVKKGKATEEEIAFFTPICKSFATDEGFQVCIDAIQVHGGYGYCKEYGIEQFSRDAKITSLYEGTNGVQAIDFVTRKVLKNKAKTLTSTLEKINKSIVMGQEHWPLECQLLKESSDKTMGIVKRFFEQALKGNEQSILTHCTDFLNYCGNNFVAWLLLDMALLANEKLKSASPSELEFLKAKQDDFQVYTQHYLTRNQGLYTTIMNFR